MTEREFAITVVRRLRETGFEALWAGGCVRDELLGLAPLDYDVATDARPEQVQKLFQRTIAVGVSFGVVEVLGPRPLKVQVATFRTDGEYRDGRRPDSVVFCNAKEDAQRRDFTINGMFFDPLENRLIDYVGGRQDLKDGVLRAIGDPLDRFTEDKLRLLRAVRMATRFDLTIDPATADAIRTLAGQINVVSSERIADELRKLLVHPRRARGMQMLDELALVAPLFPELLEMKGLPHGPPAAPNGDLWTHVLGVLAILEGPRWPAPEPVSFPLALAALLHDVGKRRTLGQTDDQYTFHGHEHIGRRMAAEIGLRLKLANAERARLEWLVEKHQYLCDAPNMSGSNLKPVLIHPGIGELLALHRADSIASGRSAAHVDFCEKMLRETPELELNPPFLITGDDLAALGLEAGPRYKQLLDAVRDAQLNGTIRTRQAALELVEKMIKAEAI